MGKWGERERVVGKANERGKRSGSGAKKEDGVGRQSKRIKVVCYQ